MKVAVLYGAMPNYDGELSRALKIVTDTLTELEVDIENINLAYKQIPYFDGVKATATEEIVRQIESADGIIFATTAMLYEISAVMSTFLEHFELSEYEESLRNKNCMVLVTSHAADERHVLESFSMILNKFGAFDAVRIGLSASLTKTLDTEITREIIIKQVEDFYRMVRQNRRFFVSSDVGRFRPPTVSTPLDGLSQKQYDTLEQLEKRQKMDISEVYEKLSLHTMTSKQEQDINEITQILSKKFTEPLEHRPLQILQEPLIPRTSQTQQVAPRAKTCKQMTQSMPHYFQPQLAAGFNAVLQVNVSGAEKFEAQIQIANAECQYVDGTASAPDITILADAAVWRDVLTGKCTAQKAFMIGKLKVRGNFVVLTKLDQLFKPMT